MHIRENDYNFACVRSINAGLQQVKEFSSFELGFSWAPFGCLNFRATGKKYLGNYLLIDKKLTSGGSVFVDLFLVIRMKLYYPNENEINPRKMDFENEKDKNFHFC